MTHLFDPLTLRSVTVRNRVWISPMCQYAVERRDGVPTAWHAVHLGQFALGGAGAVIVEATAVSPEGRISPRDTGIWNDQQAAAWAPITAFLSAHGATPGIQLAHAGRKASTRAPWGEGAGSGSVPAAEGGWETLAPSAVAFEGYAVPREMTLTDIAGVARDFASAARRAVDAGFELLEIHAAHGYLLHQFLSPLSNLRRDSFGGSLENRARLLLTVIREVRTRVGEVPILVRFSATDWTEGGLSVEDIATVAGLAVEAGADFYDISSGGLIPGARIPVGPGYQVPLAAHIGAEVSVPVGAVGLITTAEQAQEIVASGDADVVLIGREALRNPHFALEAATTLGRSEGLIPGPYERAYGH
ncbi:NADH:flavin oxidoreductase/NADH oxidase [Mycetocola spongiae]|uniref:NADH:flavin oxidoreductase/NADH oxidase n=1 Tax=Mycetocola spongiae TaxID=2859226 RepID=UPI001CF52076|nr:NADH:flavin oxidoreductase/NADH oxidase [Mycetocola spongiae]UCR90265.1 NADH:flavin oxidoreductase/NADH oxidase [Mycetocola spongiae]